VSTEVVEFVGGPKCGDQMVLSDAGVVLAFARFIVSAKQLFSGHANGPTPLVISEYERTSDRHKGRVIYRWKGDLCA
jgi:hypothetical protein